MVRKFTEGDFSGNLSYLEEGRLHQLFGSVDHLAKALAAQGEMTGRAKAFLKDTISDISHQLKTPLAAKCIVKLYQQNLKIRKPS